MIRFFSQATPGFVLALIASSTYAEQFGADLTLSKSITIDEAIQVTEAGNIENLLIEGEVTAVCQVKGCWMGFTTQKGDVRVTFKDYDFFVPLTIIGKTVLAEGSLEKVELSLKDSKHFVEDAGGNPDTVTEPIVEYQMVASGVKVSS